VRDQVFVLVETPSPLENKPTQTSHIYLQLLLFDTVEFFVVVDFLILVSIGAIWRCI